MRRRTVNDELRESLDVEEVRPPTPRQPRGVERFLRSALFPLMVIVIVVFIISRVAA